MSIFTKLFKSDEEQSSADDEVKRLIAIVSTKTTGSNLPDQVNAANELGKIGGTQATKALILALENDNVRRAAAEALGKIGDSKVIEPMKKAIKNVQSKISQMKTEKESLNDPEFGELTDDQINEMEEDIKVIENVIRTLSS
jgi:HEAT repeat protein